MADNDAKVTQFTFKGKVYDYVENATIGELAYVENRVGKSITDFYRAEASASGWFISIRRGQLGAGEPLLSWDEMLNTTQADFEDVAPTPTAVEPETELPEDQWPLDPKDDGTPTDPPFASDRSL